MSIGAESERGAFAVILTHGLSGVIEELRTIDPIDLVSFVRFGSYAALEDLLQSSTELFFRENTVTFGWTAGVDLSWDQGPTVTLGMEFRQGDVSVFFDLSLSAATHSVDVVSVLFDPPCRDSAEQLAVLAEAVADAHLPKRLAAVSGLRLPSRR